MHNEKPKSDTGDEEIHKLALERFELTAVAEQPIRDAGLEDYEFGAGEQWDEQLRRAREEDYRPVLTINRLSQTIHQVENDQRQNRPKIKISPVDDMADIETAKIMQGMVRHIEYASDADTAYDTAFSGAVRNSFGYFRIITDYVNPFAFEQELRIKRVRNPFSVYFDPYSQEIDGSDANFAFVVEDLSPDEYKLKYPDSELCSFDDWGSVGNNRPTWLTDSSARVAEYFYREWKDDTLCRIAILTESGPQTTVALKSALPSDTPYSILDERPTRVPVVHWCKINAVEILEKTVWPGRWIPIIPVYGNELDINGKRILESLIRHAKDSQRMYNYWASSETETIALAPRAPYIGYAGQFEGFEPQWETANLRNHAFLQVNPTMINGQIAPLPQRNVFEPPVQAITNARMIASDDVKATTGVYDASLGNKSNENSGVAIQRRNMQSQTANFHFMDNLAKAIRHGGRILVDAIPFVYDTARATRILGEEGTEEIVQINKIFNHNGKDVEYKMGVGQYDVTVDTGPSFETKRQEAAAAMSDMARAYPQLMQFAGDLMVKNMDWPGSQEIAERIRKTLPPGLAEEKNKQPIPPEAQAQMGQMNQMIEQLTQQLNIASEKANTKVMELESKERIEFAKLEQQAAIELAKLQSNEATALLAHQMASMNRRLDMLDINQPIEDEQIQSGVGAQDAAIEPQMQPQQQPTGGFSPASMGEIHEY